MSPQVVSLSLAGFFALLLLAAAYRGHRMPLPLILVLVVVGATVVLAPTAFSFALQLAGRQPRITEDERITCWILGGVMVLVGMFAGIMPARRPPERS